MTITGGDVSTTGQAGLVWADNGGGTAEGVVVRGPRLGVQLGGSAKVTLTGLVVDRSQAAVLAGGSSSGTATRLSCGVGSGAVVVLSESTTLTLVDSPSCPVQRQ